MSASDPEVKEVEVIAPEKTNGRKPTRAIAKREQTAVATTRTPDINDLMAQAIATGNMDTIERVFALRTQLKHESAKEAFYAALSAFQNECPVIKKTKVVPFRGGQGVMYRYAPLDKIVKVVAPLLTRHGLSYNIQTVIDLMDGTPFMVATINIYHSMGHMETSEFRVPLNAAAIDATHMNDAQRYGSAGMYAKRNAFVNGFGILSGDEDDDGAGTAYTPKEARETRQPVRQPQQTPSAQKANGAKEQKVKVDLEPAGEGEAALDKNTVTGLVKAMERATLSNADFTKRFPKLQGLEQVRQADTRVVLLWIGDPRGK